MTPSGARPAENDSIRSVRYGCSRTRSSSGRVKLAGLSQTAFDTPRRPMSWTNAARRSQHTPPVAGELHTGEHPLPQRKARTPDVLDQERGRRPCLAEVIAIVCVPLNSQIVSEPLSLLIRVSVAAHPREQARVVQDASFSIVDGRALSQPQGDQARPDHVLHRLPETQVGPERQQGDKFSAANPRASLRPCGTNLPHRRRLTPDVAPLQLADNRTEWPTTWIGECRGHRSP
jgi:hypothetical protein